MVLNLEKDELLKHGRDALENPQGSTMQTSGLQTPRSDQAPLMIYKSSGVGANYSVIHTVTAGKIFYLTAIILSHSAGVARQMEFGPSGAELVIVDLGPEGSITIPMVAVAAYDSGTELRIKSEADNASFTIVGWEE